MIQFIGFPFVGRLRGGGDWNDVAGDTWFPGRRDGHAGMARTPLLRPSRRPLLPARVANSIPAGSGGAIRGGEGVQTAQAEPRLRLHLLYGQEVSTVAGLIYKGHLESWPDAAGVLSALLHPLLNSP